VDGSEVTPPAWFLDFVRRFDYPAGIFPSEMAFFLLRCQQVGIDSIIESGRGEGYSTSVLAAFGESRGIAVFSIDWEIDPPMAARCRQRLARFPRLELVVGSAFDELPSLLCRAPGQIALLIDGPKYDEAIYLSAAAAAYGRVRIIAHHNMDPSTTWYRHLACRFPNVERLEDSELFRCSAFPEFREWETEITKDLSGRTLESTSLGLTVLPHPGPCSAHLRGPSRVHTLCATALYWAWKVNMRSGWLFARARALLNMVA
jgi:predicted O-methyltransferase YrrM